MRIPLEKLNYKMTSLMWSRDFFWKFYNVCNFLVEISTFKQDIKLTFGRNKFGKRTRYLLK